MVQHPNMVKQFTMLQSVKIIQPIHKVQLVQLDPTSLNTDTMVQQVEMVQLAKILYLNKMVQVVLN